MAKFCIVLHDLRGGGAEKMMVRLANQLAEEGDQVELILIGAGGSNKAFVSDEVQLTELQCDRTLNAFGPLRAHLRMRNPDAILAVLTHINVLTAAVCWSLGMQRRLVVSERNTFSLDKDVNNSAVMRLAYRLAPWVYKRLYNPVIAVSKGVAEDLRQSAGLTDKHLAVAPNPVVNRETRQAAQADSTHPWLQNRRGPVVVALGRLAPQKGFDWLIEAFAAMTVNDARLLIFGEGELRADLQAQINALGLADRVDLAGYTDNPLAEIRDADAFVLSSRFEGSPNGLVEAMSVGTPVLAFDCPHGPKEILTGPLASRLLPMGDTQALKVALEAQLLQGRTSGMADSLRAAADRFSAQASAACYRRLLLAGSAL